MTLVKICGLRDVEHMVAAAEAGADLVGLNFLPTVRRYIPPETGAKAFYALAASDLPRKPTGVQGAAPAAASGGPVRGPTR